MEKSVAEQAEELLDILSHDALKIFVHETCMNDSKYRQLFVAKHVHLLYPESKELYNRQLQTLAKVYADKYGFIGYQEARRLGHIVSEMTEEAMFDIKKGKIQKSMFVALATIEEMLNVISHNADDSDGQIGGSIENAFEVLNILTESKLNKMQHDELFNCLLTLFENDLLKGWDWHFTSIALAIKLVRTKQEKEKIKSALNNIIPDEKSWDYKKSQELMQELIKKTEGDENA